MRLQVGDIDAFNYVPYINGKKETNCIMADEEKGEALVYVHPDMSTFVDKYPTAIIQVQQFPLEPMTALVKGEVKFQYIGSLR